MNIGTTVWTKVYLSFQAARQGTGEANQGVASNSHERCGREAHLILMDWRLF